MTADMTPLSPDVLSELLAYAPREAFGPESPHPALVLSLAGADAALGEWLRALPCPVIGIGNGPLAAACDVVLADEKPLEVLVDAIRRNPITAMVLVQHLRAIEGLPMADALTVESLAYATLQTGPEFRRWQAAGPRGAAALPNAEGPPLKLEPRDGGLRITLNRPKTLNAMDVEMRDALCEAFAFAALDPDIAAVELCAAGRGFSVGGETREFGLARDPATAHWIRSVRLPARAILPLRDRLTARIAGATMGGGLELAAFARRIVATPDAWFQLPELKYGLIPGAGGTVSIPARIGRQRAAYLMLSMRRLSAEKALAWGLIDVVEP